jgi:hypothetical protein
VEQSSLELLEEPLLRPGQMKWEIHARVTALSSDHGRRKFALWVDVSQFEQREHGLCVSGTLTPPFKVARRAVGGGDGGKGGGGAARGAAAVAAAAHMPVRESSRRKEKEKAAEASAVAAVAAVASGGKARGGNVKVTRGKAGSSLSASSSVTSSSRR